MLLIPFSENKGTYKLFVVLQEDNMHRLAAQDPAQIKLPIPGFEHKRLEMVLVGYADPAHTDTIMRLIHEEKIAKVLQLLTCGFEFRPDLGDHDGPPLSVRPQKGETKQ